MGVETLNGKGQAAVRYLSTIAHTAPQWQTR